MIPTPATATEQSHAMLAKRRWRTIACAVCGTPRRTQDSQALYCSPKCSSHAKYLRQVARTAARIARAEKLRAKRAKKKGATL